MNFSSQIIVHPKNFSTMELIAIHYFPQVLQLLFFQIQHQQTWYFLPIYLTFLPFLSFSFVRALL